MADAVSRRRGTQSELNVTVAKQSEFFHNTTNQSLHIGDGSNTAGASPELPNKEFTTDGTIYFDENIGSAPDAYIFDPKANTRTPTQYTDGLELGGITTNQGTGAATVNFAGLGQKPIKQAGGADPTAGQIIGRIRLIFDAGNNWFELQSATVQTQRINKIYQFTSTTYVPPTTPPPLNIMFEATGAGAGAGGIDSVGGSTAAVGDDGSAGGTAIKTTNIIDASYAIVIGAKGVGGAAGNNAGTNGGNTTVVSVNVNLTCNGGQFGDGTVASIINTFHLDNTGGTAVGGDINIQGGNSVGGHQIGGVSSGRGSPGGSYWGPGPAKSFSAPGNDAVNFGSGGSSIFTLVGDTVDEGGGDGAPGLVVITEYF